jgi:hypothetical protein
MNSFKLDDDTPEILVIGQLDTVLCKWLTGVNFEGLPVMKLAIIERAKTFYDEMKITDKCTVIVGCKVTRNYL